MMICVQFSSIVSLLENCSNFFFQAEDGIRDSVASRGLGDVYKRQIVHASVYCYYVLLYARTIELPQQHIESIA